LTTIISRKGEEKREIRQLEFNIVLPIKATIKISIGEIAIEREIDGRNNVGTLS